MEHTFNLCRNKGHARIWIEGKRLTEAKWSTGDRFNKDFSVDGTAIVLHRNPKGQHRIAGSAERPIIDLNGKYLTDFFGKSKKYTAIFEAHRITIVKE